MDPILLSYGLDWINHNTGYNYTVSWVDEQKTAYIFKNGNYTGVSYSLYGGQPIVGGKMIVDSYQLEQDLGVQSGDALYYYISPNLDVFNCQIGFLTARDASIQAGIALNDKSKSIGSELGIAINKNPSNGYYVIGDDTHRISRGTAEYVEVGIQDNTVAVVHIHCRPDGADGFSEADKDYSLSLYYKGYDVAYYVVDKHNRLLFYQYVGGGRADEKDLGSF